jgi:hypothetical protein
MMDMRVFDIGDLLWNRSTVLSRHGSGWKIGEAALGRGRLPPFQGLLEVVQSAGNLVGKLFTLFAEDDVLVIGKRELAAPAEALPQQHR